MTMLDAGAGASVGVDTGDIGHSLRYRRANSASKSRTFATPTNNTSWALSRWIKRGDLLTQQSLLSAGQTSIDFLSGANVSFRKAGAAVATSTAVVRDPTGHGHLFVRSNGTNVKAYWNNVEILSYTGTLPEINSAVLHYSGRYANAAQDFFDGYESRDCFVDGGGSLTPSDFAYQNTETNAWVTKSQAAVKAVVDAGGTNSFMLDFDDGTSLTTLGYDKSSKGNNWTLNNFSLTPGLNYDWMLDTPSNNFATLNNIYPSAANITNGNLSSGTTAARGTFNSTVFDSQWFVTAGASNVTAGVIDDSGSTNTTTVTANKVFAFKMTSAGALSYKNVTDAGSWTSIATGLTGNRWPYGVTAAASWNFGQQPLPEAFDTGFRALCTANLPEVSGAALNPKKHFDIALSTGANIKTASEALFPSNFLEWIKDRGADNNHQLIDIVRGTSAVLQSNTTAAETTYVAPSSSSVGWVWKAGGAPVTNTAGSITSQVSANVEAGFSIVTYTGTGANATVGHGLGVAPKMVIVKERTNAGRHWFVQHASMATSPQQGRLLLNDTGAYASDPAAWNNLAPTSSLFSIGTGIYTNTSAANHVAYCFAEIPGYSKIGSYVGNGSSEGPNIICGFKPRWLLVKRADSTGSWHLLDAARDPHNTITKDLIANGSQAEGGSPPVDFVASGFKIRGDGTFSDYNANGGTYIFMAIAETNFKYANAR